MRNRRFFRSEEGSTLVEFAMLAPVFFMLVMGLIEFVLFQYKSYTLNYIVYEATRNLQTGEIQGAANQKAAFEEEICKRAGPLVDCKSIYYDVRAFDNVDDIDYPPVKFDEKGVPTNFVFKPGGPNKYSVVRASIHHQFITPYMDRLFKMGPDLPGIVNSFCIVRNEPWA